MISKLALVRGLRLLLKFSSTSSILPLKLDVQDAPLDVGTELDGCGCVKDLDQHDQKALLGPWCGQDFKILPKLNLITRYYIKFGRRRWRGSSSSMITRSSLWGSLITLRQPAKNSDNQQTTCSSCFDAEWCTGSDDLSPLLYGGKGSFRDKRKMHGKKRQKIKVKISKHSMCGDVISPGFCSGLWSVLETIFQNVNGYLIWDQSFLPLCFPLQLEVHFLGIVWLSWLHCRCAIVINHCWSYYIQYYFHVLWSSTRFSLRI